MKEIQILQVKDVHECKYGFMNWEYAKDKFNINDYKMIGWFEVEDKDNNEILNWVWEKGNDGTLQQTYSMRSISVSDLIAIDDKLYYVDSLGFKEVEQ